MMLKVLTRGPKGEIYPVPDKANRIKNFKQLVQENFIRDPFAIRPWPKVLDGLNAYEKFKSYAQTDYDAAMIYRILKDNKVRDSHNQERFRVHYFADGQEGMAQGNANFLTLSPRFNSGRHPGGEKRFGLSIIHHELGHTRFGLRKKTGQY
jgi:hypothetical protein